MIRTLMATSAATALLLGTAWAQTTAVDPTTTEPAAESTADTTTPAVEQMGSEADDMATEAEDLAEDTADAVENAAEETVDAIDETADDLTTPAEGAEDVPAEAMDTTPEADAGSVDMAREGWGDVEEGYSRVPLETVSAEMVVGSDITNLDGEKVASVGDLLLDDSGKMEYVVAEFGGFLGFGEQTVLLGIDNVDILTNVESGEAVVRTNLTPEALEAMPEYEPAES